MAYEVVVEHLNHLGIVAEVCREIGVAEWLDQQDPTKQQQVSVGTATVAMVLNGLGLSNRRLYLAPQFFANKPVLCLLVYRLAKHRLQQQLATTGQTVPNQVSKPTDRPTLRWIFQVFEGVSLLTFPQPGGPPQQDTMGLEPVHEQVLALLGPSYEKRYKLE